MRAQVTAMPNEKSVMFRHLFVEKIEQLISTASRVWYMFLFENLKEIF